MFFAWLQLAKLAFGFVSVPIQFLILCLKLRFSVSNVYQRNFGTQHQRGY